MKIVLETLGCKLNQAETESLARQLAQAGHQVVDSVSEADLYILNTCTVTQTADAKSRQMLRQAHHKNAKAFLVATGCYAQRVPEELQKLAGVTLVAGNDEKAALPYLLDEIACADGVCPVPADDGGAEPAAARKRAFLKIQEGCSKHCAYCIVPAVRGIEKSQPAEQIISEIKERAADDVKEVVLTGTEVGAYESEGFDLKSLLERVLAETEIERIRLSSLQPQEITPHLVALWRDERLCPHFHLSLQSGSNSVLRRMKRQYSVNGYRKAISLIRSIIPEAAITTDVIAGFPGETDVEFEESLAFCREMDFASIHVFSFSPRQGTEAAVAAGQIDEKVKKQRSEALLVLAEESTEKYMRGFEGRTMPVLFEHKVDGVWLGHTANYIKIYAESGDALSNKIVPVTLAEIRGDGVRGKILNTAV